MRLENKATLVSMSVATLLVIMKFTIATISGSVAILASAIDSLLDLSVSAFNFFILHNSQKGSDETFNFGRSKLEPLAAVVEGAVITLSAIFIFYQAVIKIIHEKPTLHLNESVIVMIISLLITTFLVIFLAKVAQKTHNIVIKADSIHYKTDLFSNIGVLLGLLLISFTKIEIIDPIVGLMIAFYMIYSAIPIIKEGLYMLLDISLGTNELNKIKNILDNNQDISTYHFLNTRTSGSEIFISAHLVFDTQTTLLNAHTVSDKIELQLQQLFPNYKVRTIMHLDPYDDSNIEISQQV